jgi:hypothetical protein
VTRQRILVALNGATAIAAIAALITILLNPPRFSNVERQIREVRKEIVQLELPPGVHARVTRKEVMPRTTPPPARGRRPARA